MAGNVKDGGRRLQLYTVDASVTPATIGATAVLTLTEQISTSLSKDDSGIFTVSLEQIDATSTFFDFVRTYASPADGAAPEDITYEDNSKMLGAASVGTKFLALVRGATVTGGADASKRVSFYGVVAVSRTSGSFDMSGGTYIKPSFEMTSAPIDYDVVILATMMTSFMQTPAALTLSSTNDKYGRVKVA